MIGLFASALLLGEVIAETRLRAGMIIEPVHVAGEASDTERFLGRQVTRTIFPGRAVTLADTKEPDLVERNAIVRIVARKGPLKIETMGRSLGAGATGDEIMVMNMESRRTISATIIGPSTVEVRL